jgi:hypothetical protein
VGEREYVEAKEKISGRKRIFVGKKRRLVGE